MTTFSSSGEKEEKVPWLSEEADTTILPKSCGRAREEDAKREFWRAIHRKPINPLIDAIKGLNGLFDVMGFGR